jgi:superfamily II DNA or RNA helicase
MAEKRGVIVLPTGSGKTLIALKAISTLNLSAIVIVPTLDLMGQWISRISEEFDVEVGMYGGGEHILQPVTVATYDTAYIMAGNIGNRFGLVIFDECTICLHPDMRISRRCLHLHTGWV